MKKNVRVDNGITITEISYEESDLSTDTEREMWINICNQCSEYDNRICKKCGCIVDNLMTLSTSKCPIGKW